MLALIVVFWCLLLLLVLDKFRLSKSHLPGQAPPRNFDWRASTRLHLDLTSKLHHPVVFFFFSSTLSFITSTEYSVCFPSTLANNHRKQCNKYVCNASPAMSSSDIRLRLVIQRHGVPEVKLVWPCAPNEDFTIARLLNDVNEVVPLEGGEWGLEDYAVELSDPQGGSSFECLHFQKVGKVLKEGDQVM